MTAKGRRGENATTIFHEILHSGLPAVDKTQLRVTDEAQIVVAAGVETTAFALSVGSFHIVNTPRIYEKLRTELVVAFPDGDTTIPDLLALEKLPYLRGCIQESLRLSYGLSARNPRRHPDRPLVYKDWVIPAGTMVGMTIVDVHHDETIFPNSHEFRPERWLDDPRAPDGSPLDHYLVAFGRGTRVCLGMKYARPAHSWQSREYFISLSSFSLLTVQNTVWLGPSYFSPWERSSDASSSSSSKPT